MEIYLGEEVGIDNCLVGEERKISVWECDRQIW